MQANAKCHSSFCGIAVFTENPKGKDVSLNESPTIFNYTISPKDSKDIIFNL